MFLCTCRQYKQLAEKAGNKHLHLPWCLLYEKFEEQLRALELKRDRDESSKL